MPVMSENLIIPSYRLSMHPSGFDCIADMHMSNRDVLFIPTLLSIPHIWCGEITFILSSLTFEIHLKHSNEKIDFV